MKYLVRVAALLILVALIFGLVLAFGPSVYWRSPELPANLPAGDPERGAYVAVIGGCAACHTAEGKDAKPLAGGRRLETEFGIFVVPNITPDPETGIGDWSQADFIRAMTLGLSPDGRHYYPSFPYTSYTRMSLRDLVDLKAHLDSIDSVRNETAPHELDFPYSVRPGLGLWKFAFFSPGWQKLETDREKIWSRGAYLALGPGHCVECHTPRNFAGALRMDDAFSGTPEGPEGGRVPNLTPHEDGLKGWNRGQIAEYLELGMTPGGDFAGGAMAEVIRNSTGKMTPEDRQALAVYLLSLPQRPFGGE